METYSTIFVLLCIVLMVAIPSKNPRKERAEKRARFDEAQKAHESKQKMAADQKAANDKREAQTKEENVLAHGAAFEAEKKKARGNGLLQSVVSARFTSDESDSSYGFRYTVDFLRYYGQIWYVGGLVCLAFIAVPAARIEKYMESQKNPSSSANTATSVVSIYTEISTLVPTQLPTQQPAPTEMVETYDPSIGNGQRYCALTGPAVLFDENWKQFSNPQGNYSCFVLTHEWIQKTVVKSPVDGNQYFQLIEKSTGRIVYIAFDYAYYQY